MIAQNIKHKHDHKNNTIYKNDCLRQWGNYSFKINNVLFHVLNDSPTLALNNLYMMKNILLKSIE
ncbi:hypothetical protein V1478_007698 [Vespula squamosa]|uniref:Uncharacterized protein n=1 Tax=Vespula squamosa TaxID=30214 RepID=A0ABD2AX23_VESSQ